MVATLNELQGDAPKDINMESGPMGWLFDVTRLRKVRGRESAGTMPIIKQLRGWFRLVPGFVPGPSGLMRCSARHRLRGPERGSDSCRQTANC